MPSNRASQEGYEALTPVMAELGRAVFACQCLEATVRALALMATHDLVADEGAQFQAALELQEAKPENLRNLIKRLKGLVGVSVPEVLLLEAAAVRNEVVHSYLVRNVLRLANQSGRQEVESELAAFKSKLHAAEDGLQPFVDLLLAKYSLSVQYLESRAEALWAYQNASSPTVQ